MRELSIFVDESGDIGDCSTFYLIALVFHDQDEDLREGVEKYVRSLSDSGLDAVPFHFAPIMRGHDQYEAMTLDTRKSYFSHFRIFAERAPYRYHVLCYEKSQFPSVYKLAERIERDLEEFINSQLTFFQRFDRVKIYYDNGQQIVKHAVHQAIRNCLSKHAAIYRNARPNDYHLFQVADYVCGIELAALRHELHADNPTDHRFFGDKRSFTRNYLRRVREKLL